MKQYFWWEFYITHKTKWSVAHICVHNVLGTWERSMAYIFPTTLCKLERQFSLNLSLFLPIVVTWYTMRGPIPPSASRNRDKSFDIVYCCSIKYISFLSAILIRIESQPNVKSIYLRKSFRGNRSKIAGLSSTDQAIIGHPRVRKPKTQFP